jgi:uncharacterized membrane protein
MNACFLGGSFLFLDFINHPAEQSRAAAEQQQQQTYHQSVNEFFWNFITPVARLQFLGD